MLFWLLFFPGPPRERSAFAAPTTRTRRKSNLHHQHHHQQKNIRRKTRAAVAERSNTECLERRERRERRGGVAHICLHSPPLALHEACCPCMSFFLCRPLEERIEGPFPTLCIVKNKNKQSTNKQRKKKDNQRVPRVFTLLPMIATSRVACAPPPLISRRNWRFNSWLTAFAFAFAFFFYFSLQSCWSPMLPAPDPSFTLTRPASKLTQETMRTKAMT